MKILVINSGSSSIKYQLFDMARQEVLTSGLVERIGLDGSRIKHKTFVDNTPREVVKELPVPNHKRGLELVADMLMDEDIGVISGPAEIGAVGHRAVHGGEFFSQTTVITAEVIAKIRELIPLAPLHNPANLQGIEVAREIFPHAPQVAVFDTAFHQTMPPAAYRYALPGPSTPSKASAPTAFTAPLTCMSPKPPPPIWAAPWPRPTSSPPTWATGPALPPSKAANRSIPRWASAHFPA
jgi:acetate kinase